MNVQMNVPNLISNEGNQGNETSLEDSPKSTGFIYMDMQVYNEDEESSDSVEVKKESFGEDTCEIEENLPLNSIKNLTYHSENESNLENSDKDTNIKTKKWQEVIYNSDSGQKENLSSEPNTEENSKQKRYRLRNRSKTKKVNLNLLGYETNSKKSLSLNQNNACSKCETSFPNKTQFLKHKKEIQKFKCLFCRKCFCSNNFLEKHLKMCKLKSLKIGKNTLSCEKCGEVFGEKSELESHLNVHEDLFKCQKCQTKFIEKTELEYHIFQNQCGLQNYTCDICKQTFSHINSLRRHITAHMNNLSQSHNSSDLAEDALLSKIDSQINSRHFCHICNKTFSDSCSLKIHFLQHQGISYKCFKCNTFFVSQESLDNHLKEVDCLSLSQKCMKCGKVYKDNINYQKHLQTHKDNIMKCINCNKVFIDALKFSDHLNSDCQKLLSRKKFKYDCDACGGTFNKLVKLKIHILNVHQGINYQCEKCKLKFICQEDLDVHTFKQDCKPEDPCTCKICGKVFAKKDYLKKHQYMHTNVLFKCKYCYCAFMKEKNYKRHMEKMNCSKSARKIRMAEYNFKKCRICDLEYETEELLIEHFGNAHQDEKPHQCFCCEMSLSTFRDLQNHIHHHNTQKYTCNLCGKPYTSQEGFRKHRLKHKGAEFKCRFCESEFLNESRFRFHEKVCKKNPESGYQPSQDKEKSKKKDERPKQRRQLHWESRIIMKHLRGDPQASTKNQNDGLGGKNENSLAASFFDDPETETTNERGWFDNYYKTEEDDLAFGLKKDSEEPQQDCDSEFDVNEFLQMGGSAKKKKNSSPVAVLIEDGEIDNCSDSSSTDSSSESTDETIEEVDLPIDYNPKKCRLCIIVFGQEYELLHHFIKTHPGEYAHKCPNCEVQSPLFAQLKEHMKSHGIGIGVYNCDNCSKKFKSEKKMKSHNFRCKGMNADNGAFDSKRSLQLWEEHCKKCGKKFHSKFGYRRHKQLCKAKKEKNKKSSDFEKSKAQSYVDNFIESNDFQLSDAEEEPIKEKPDIPDNSECNNKTSVTLPTTPEVVSKSDGKKSEVKDSYVGEPPMDSFPCRLCDKKFQYERGIVMHFKSAHPGNKPLICHVCNMHLADKLKEHLKTHGIGEEFICELCGKRFNQKFLSKIHEMWHQGVEYKCNNCKQKFLNKEKMDKHIGENRCSNRQSLMRLPCDICGKSYRSKFGLSKHYITHTPKELRPVKNRMNCEYCGKWFENNNGLQRHRRIHTGERPFCCRFCPKAFAQEGNCKAHERIHTGESKPRKKKLSTPLPPPPALQPPAPPPVTVDPISYPTHINLYIYNNVDPNGIVH